MAKEYLSATPPYVIVEKGDTLSEIAEKYASRIAGTGIYGNNGKLATLTKINDITNADRIVVGQKIQLSGSSTAKKNNTSKAVIKAFGLQSNTDRTMYATWTWSKSNTEHYRVIWQYDTGDGVWFNGEDTTTKEKQAIYSGAPQNADRVRFKVLPVAKKRKVNGKETAYWTASWSTLKTYAFKSNPPTEPTGLNVEIKDGTLTATLDNLDVNATSIEFQVVRNNSAVYKTGKATIKTGHASFSCTVTTGSEYKVRCRAVRGSLYSDWTDYSDNQKTVPAAPSAITDCAAETETAIHLEWTTVKGAESYTIEYATEKKYFDQSDQTTTLSNVTASPFWSIYNLETGLEYFFRVRAENAEGSSKWSPIVSVILGTAPSAPTTWSSTTTAIVGEPLTLYWIHNSEDGSDPTYAKLEMTITTLSDAGVESTYTDILELNYGSESVTEEESSGFLDTLKNLFTAGKKNDDKESTASSYTIETANFPEGATIRWAVRTKGVTNAYSAASMTRTIDIYAQPTLSLGVTNKEGVLFDIFESFPLYVKAEPAPKTQRPIGYHLSVISNDIYETVDNMGNAQTINKGEEVYSEYFEYDDILEVELSANNINLDNNISYSVKCVVSMDSGLNAEAVYPFTVAWEDEEFEPNAEIFIDEENLSASIRPFCEDGNGEPIADILMSVYRREFDGSFTELAKDIENTSYTFITDPHPALDFARYRVVAKTIATGGISYYDVPGYPVNEKGIVLQWDEAWSNFNISNENFDELAEPTWSGSLLRLPYNVDVSDSYKPESSLVEYIGRKNPVSYYGTQLGETSTWSVAIPKTDKETLYAIRRLAVWLGDVYVREPSGSGYWANVTVSFSQTHCELTIPVTFNITRVEGGV